MILNGKAYEPIYTEAKLKKGKTETVAVCYKIDLGILEDCEQEIKAHHSYGKDDELLAHIIKEHPHNTDVNIVAMKIALIDVTNSTHLSQHKDKVSVVELADFITKIDFDNRVGGYDKTLVSEIANFNGKINLFSFASKYCCLHNRHVHGRDDYPKYDGVIARCLPVYLKQPQYDIGRKVTESYLDTIRKRGEYDEFKSLIDDFIAKVGLSDAKGIRRMMDHFIWYTNRDNKNSSEGSGGVLA